MFNRNSASTSTSPSAAPAAAPAGRQAVEPLLVEGEDLLATLGTDNRDIAVTNRRVFLMEDGGNWAVIAVASVSSLEISDAGAGSVFAKIHFGGGLSRTVKLNSFNDAAALAGALAL
ncbi:hypothetical protein E8D34_14845 [Nocardioides sp. GY 10113]|uniref:hypothetical protein n=1 Tax=Nocardioides sp. GY 10113 TaxID=2569761 RepID=UPI0010A85830|nr:hypothetical protein [Nocardioides sp. GY 10113]TIC83839.1 hypothetical protein E8D34_14845 [Nocardioides sp. GY 10113]